MKILSFNVWGGRLYEPLMEFIRTNADNFDVLNFQEMYSTLDNQPVDAGNLPDELPGRGNLFYELTNILPDHVGHFSPAVSNAWKQEGLQYGLAQFIRSEYKADYHEAFIFGSHRDDMAEYIEGANHPRNIQALTLGDLTICNYHGLYTGGGKGDNSDRLAQSEDVRMFLEGIGGEYVLSGDFNLLPDTESLAILNKGNRNLVLENGVTSTRSSHYPKENKFADYAIVTPGVEVVSFNVLPDEVSDHLPLLIEIAF